ncbi:MAG TPA: OPT/YSL family transporter, partial [Bryobacteraceae bacterium]|nr:OPT/YSL family transporter [Bryobacteraceae bacterium]
GAHAAWLSGAGSSIAAICPEGPARAIAAAMLDAAQSAGFGGRSLPAPQAGLMASLSQGIVGGVMPWPLVGVGILMGLALIMVQVRSPMLFAVGMYLPLETTFAIFIGGIIRWITSLFEKRRNFNDAQKARVENAGVLTASGLIAGEAMMGLVIAAFRFFEKSPPQVLAAGSGLSQVLAAVALLVIALIMIRVPLANAGRPDEPAPPTAVM